MCYSLKCQSCPEGEATYVGQTSSTAYVRGGEHQREYRLHEGGKEGGKKSVMGRHVASEHGGDYSTAWTMTVLSHHLLKTHERQVNEAVLIDEYDSGTLINTRCEKGADLVSGPSLSHI